MTGEEVNGAGDLPGTEQVSPGDLHGGDHKERVEDAAMLLDYAISIGADVPDEVIAKVQSAKDGDVGKDFDSIYRDLARLMHPVTARTVRSTQPRDRGKSEAELWSRTLWWWTLATVCLILFAEGVVRLTGTFVPVDAHTDAELFAETPGIMSVIAAEAAMVLPFLYGLFGACAYILRRCHQTIYTRTFDSLRKREYMNRMLLGLVSGGAIGFFGDGLLTAEITESFDGATLAFLAGYSADFVFTAIERVVAALLPKVEAQRPPDPEQPADSAARSTTPASNASRLADHSSGARRGNP